MKRNTNVFKVDRSKFAELYNNGASIMSLQKKFKIWCASVYRILNELWIDCRRGEKQKKYHKQSCPICNKEFKSNTWHPRVFCSQPCYRKYLKDIHYNQYNKDNYTLKKKWSKRTIATQYRKSVWKEECMLCGWDKTTCDIHHIISLSSGWEDRIENMIMVCPNCHRQIHKWFYTVSQLFEKIKCLQTL